MQNSINFRIYYEDTDAQGIVYHANYLKFCERARSEMLLSANIGGFDKDKHFVISHIDAKFIQPAKLNEMIKVNTKTVKVGASKVVLSQQISKIDELKTPIFTAIITLAYIKNGKPSKMSEDLGEFFKNYI